MNVYVYMFVFVIDQYIDNSTSVSAFASVFGIRVCWLLPIFRIADSIDLLNDATDAVIRSNFPSIAAVGFLQVKWLNQVAILWGLTYVLISFKLSSLHDLCGFLFWSDANWKNKKKAGKAVENWKEKKYFLFPFYHSLPFVNHFWINKYFKIIFSLPLNSITSQGKHLSRLCFLA